MGLPHEDIATLQNQQQGLFTNVNELQASQGRELELLKASIAAVDKRVTEAFQFFSPIVGELRQSVRDIEFKIAKVSGDVKIVADRVSALEARVTRLEGKVIF